MPNISRKSASPSVVALARIIGLALLLFFSTPSTSSQTATPTPNVNRLMNGDFETGDLSQWQGNTEITIDAADPHGGIYAAHVTQASTWHQGWITVTPGKTYVASAWFKWVAMSDSDWGYSGFSVSDENFQDIEGISNLDQRYERNVWNKIAFTFTPTSNQVMVNFGMFGPEPTVDLYFDDIMLFEKTGNIPPETNIQADIISGTAPLTINFTSDASDDDGAVGVYQWLFGDGSEARIANPAHMYLSEGTFTATLNAFDNDGAKSSQDVVITVTNPQAPRTEISEPASSDRFSTAEISITLSGTAESDSSQITGVVWDNVTSGDAGIISITPGNSVNWSIESMPLKPGDNEILVTSTDADGKVGTDKIWITRSIDGPSIDHIETNTTTPRVYEKYEVTFQVTTVADQPMFMYDPNPPAGAERYSGVTVEGVITLPDGQVVTQPGFYDEEATKSGSVYKLTGNKFWKLRYAPQQTGTYEVSIRVTDKSGTVTTPVRSFTAQEPTKPGYIQVSQRDSRYFEYTNGTLYWPIGMTWTGAEIPENGGAPSVINYDRPWMAGRGAWSSNWSRWISSAETLGNEGVGMHYSFLEHYPSSEISQHIHAPDGSRMWISCWLDADFCAQIDGGKTYQVKLRVKTQGITGPAQTDIPYGLVIKNHDWPPENFEEAMRSAPSWIPIISQDTDWHTIVTRVTAATGGDDFSIYLDNVTGGEAFIDEFSVREVMADGSLGPEQIRNPRADWHTYVEQRPMASFDDEVAEGEANGIFLRYVVADKNDRLINALNAPGIFVNYGDGYYQLENTKATWLEKQWWRYLVARLGYSTAVFGWELNNEGPPDDGTGAHARTTQIFAKWMHDLDAHPHLATTSFWCCWEPTFWGDNTQFSDVDFADIHHYGSPTDMVQWYLDEAVPAYNSHVGKPIVRGETGIWDAANNPEPALRNPNPGIWYHNLLWSQLDYSAMFDIGYWYPEHGEAIIGGRTPIARAFANFISDLDLNAGGYEDINASSSQEKFRILGQKNLAQDRAHGWINHVDYTWKNVMDNGEPAAVSGTVTFIMNPNKTYTVSWYDTYAGTISGTEQVTSDASGELTLSVDSLSSDVAFKVS